MSWVKFFRSKSIEDTLKNRKKGQMFINPLLKSRYKFQLRRMFNLAQTRFIFDRSLKRIGNNMESPYQKFPKGIQKQERELVKRITKVRLGILNAKEKELKWRQDFINKRKYRGFPELIRGIMPTLIKQTGIKAEKTESYGGASRKVIAESVKGVPKVQKATTRKQKEHFKNFMDDAVIGSKVVSNLVSGRSKKQGDRFEAFKKKGKGEKKEGEEKKAE